MTEQVPDAVVADAAREIVARAAPQEMPLFRATSEAYFADPEKALADRKPKDEMLGFGIETAALLLTPVIIDVVRRVAIALAKIGRGRRGEGGQRGRRRVRPRPLPAWQGRGRWRGEERRAGSHAEQLDEVREIAYSRALELDVPEDRAGLLADAVVGRLATD